jgi:hypothetical protein
MTGSRLHARGTAFNNWVKPSLSFVPRNRASVRSHKSEATVDDMQADDKAKSQVGSTLLGGGIGGAIGGFAGGLLFGGLGGLIGGLVGGLIGGLIGYLLGKGGGIDWKPENYSTTAAGGKSTTRSQPFDVKYKATKNDTDWKLAVDKIQGGVDIVAHTGGSRDPMANPPTTEAEARDAVNTMKAYYTGGRGSWHTEAATKDHELWHYKEWKGSAEHYWPTALSAIEKLSAPVAAQPTDAGAITAMRGGAKGADAIVKSFYDVAQAYWFTLSDQPGSRPYAAGQLTLNSAIEFVQDLASSRGWNVPQGINKPSLDDPCYQPWLPYVV